jgi:hypothetical protein
MWKIAAAGFAALAAAFWFVSARGRFPGLTYQKPDENPLYIAPRKAAWGNVAASTSASISAALQAVAAITAGGT